MAYKSEDFVLLLAVGGFVEPVGRRASYTSSRLAILSDGTTKPVLLLLAERKYGTWEAERFPFWIDGDRTNEILSNISLATRAAGVSRQKRHRTRNAFGVPAGSREYMRRWRETHPEQVRASQSRYHEKRSALLGVPPTTSDEDGGEAVAPSIFSKIQAVIDEER